MLCNEGGARPDGGNVDMCVWVLLRLRGSDEQEREHCAKETSS